MPQALTLEDRFLGCMLGLATADAVGAPFEGLGPYDIYQNFGFARGIVDDPPLDALHYTDDTQMMIAVAECLLETGGLDEDDLMRRFVSSFDPDRGYGPGARRLIEAAARGEDWRQLRHTINPGGSLGNGAAMRAAPVGLMYRDDLDRVWDEAERSAVPTHAHPIGIEGAQLVALSVALASRMETFDRPAFFHELARRAVTEEFRWQLSVAVDLSLNDSAVQFGKTLRADRSVVSSIVCFAADPTSFRSAVAGAIALGGDTDTVAAMAGAISGAHLGGSAVPTHLIDRLEDGPKGRRYIDRLARALAAKAQA